MPTVKTRLDSGWAEEEKLQIPITKFQKITNDQMANNTSETRKILTPT